MEGERSAQLFDLLRTFAGPGILATVGTEVGGQHLVAQVADFNRQLQLGPQQVVDDLLFTPQANLALLMLSRSWASLTCISTGMVFLWKFWVR